MTGKLRIATKEDREAARNLFFIGITAINEYDGLAELMQSPPKRWKPETVARRIAEKRERAEAALRQFSDERLKIISTGGTT